MNKMNQNDVKGLQNECKCQNENDTTVDNTCSKYIPVVDFFSSRLN